MLVSWIIYGIENGEPRWFNGSSRMEDAFLQNPPDGWRQIIVPEGKTLESLVQESRVDIVRDAVWQAVKRRRAEVIGGTVETVMGRFQASAEARAAVARNAALAARDPQFSATWTDADNAEVVLNAEGLIALDEAMIRHEAAAHERSREIRKQVDAAPGVDELLSIDFMAGWPRGGGDAE